MIEVEEIDRIVAERLVSLDYCYQCGRCSGVCPLSPISDFRPRKFMIGAQLDLERMIAQDLLWQCSTCNACVAICPQEVKPPEVITSLRSKLVETGHIPQEVSDVLENIYRRNNPWGSPKGERAKWAEGLSLKEFQQGTEWLWFVGCAPSYDPRNQEVAKALVRIFQHAGLEVGFLGSEERCCGDSARRLGEEGLFQLLAEENSTRLAEAGAEKVLTTSPHCYNVFKNEYPKLEGEVRHYTQLLAELIRSGKLSFAEPDEELTVTYHDPCYLGRHNGVYEEPRFILDSLPGVKPVEMPRNRERSSCCGGGGGRMWVETKEKEHPGEIRVKEALSVGAQAIITACPFCTINFDEAVKTLNLEEQIRVLDLAELVSERLG
jgi:Fe-S oxidoreductase